MRDVLVQVGNRAPNAETLRAVTTTRTRVLGTTRIEESIGKGGMAQVYRGEQRALGRRVAVKVMLPKIARDKEMAQRFRREARTLAALQHENVVAVHDLIEKNGQVFMVLEYVEGVDVGELLGDGKALPHDIALIIATGIARALEHAHFRRIIHRDIKPANVLVSRHGEVKLADFGIAKDLGDADLTHTGFVIGTPSYLSPELLKGQRAEPRSDLYALGVLLFELLTGKKPFAHKDSQQLFAAILAGRREKLRTLAPGCPPALEKIVDRCLEPEVGARYQRAADLQRDLEVQLHAVSSGNPAARLVGFLFARGHAGAEDLGTLDIGELVSADPSLDLSKVDLSTARSSLDSIELDVELDVDVDVEPEEPDPRVAPGRRSHWSHGLVVALALALVAGALTYALAPVETAAALQRALAEAAALIAN